MVWIALHDSGFCKELLPEAMEQCVIVDGLDCCLESGFWKELLPEASSDSVGPAFS